MYFENNIQYDSNTHDFQRDEDRVYFMQKNLNKLTEEQLDKLYNIFAFEFGFIDKLEFISENLPNLGPRSGDIDKVYDIITKEFGVEDTGDYGDY